MRKILAAAAAAAALAWAGGAHADHHVGNKAGDPMGRKSAEPGAQHPGTDSATAAQDRRADERRADVKHPVFDGKKNFDMDGKVKSTSSDSITIERKDGLPPATLHVGAGTKVEVDGKRSSVASLTPGQDVKASFNMSGEKAEAVEIKADKADAKDRRELGEQRRDNQKERSERARDEQRR